MEYSEEMLRDYLLGKLSEEETARLEQKIENDRELAEAIELQRDIMVGIKAAFDDELRKKLHASVNLDKARIKKTKP